MRTGHNTEVGNVRQRKRLGEARISKAAFYWQNGKSTAEIAKRLGCRESTVYNSLEHIKWRVRYKRVPYRREETETEREREKT